MASQPDNTRPASSLNGIKNIPQKVSVSLWSPNKDSNCEGKILVYKKNKLCHISILYIKNISEECFLGI